MSNEPSQPNGLGKNLELMVGFLCVKDEPNLQKQVEILDKFQLSDSEKATICGVAAQSVRNARQKNKNQASNT